MLVHVKAIALDPRHPKVFSNFNRLETPNACVLAGTVAKLDEGVERFKIGDRVLAVTFGTDVSDKRDNFFKSVAEDHISCHIPELFSFDQACSIGILMATAGRALFQAPGLELSLHHGRNETVLISGGSTALGTMATQVSKM